MHEHILYVIHKLLINQLLEWQRYFATLLSVRHFQVSLRSSSTTNMLSNCYICAVFACFKKRAIFVQVAL